MRMKGKRNIYTTIGSYTVIGLVVVDRIILGEDVRIPLWISIPLIVISVVLVGIGVSKSIKQKNSQEDR